jgi:hypothetical protein
MRVRVAGLLVVLLVWGIPLLAQPTNPPLEYIESSSPLPGGGVVSSIYAPGRGAPVYRGGPATRLVQNGQPAAANGTAVTGQVSAPSSPTAALPAGQTPVAYGPVSATPTVARIPSLGIPLNWDRSLNAPRCCNGCATMRPASYANYAGYPPAGSTAAAIPGYSPGPATAAASVPTSHTTWSPQSPVVLQNLPPNATAGTGLFGGPRQYIDGEPVRNLFRFVFP